MMRLLNRLQGYIKTTKYNIGFVEGTLHSVIGGAPIKVNWLKHHYKDRWFADPFILDVTDAEIVVLAEEWYDPIQRGRISKLIIDKKTFELKSLKVMIDDGSHMSFPAIERIGGEIYIHPENCVVGKLESYKYDKARDCFEKVGVLCEEPLTDSAITNLFGVPYLFSTKVPDTNGKELGIYSWNPATRKFALQDIYHFHENLSRMAGDLSIRKYKYRLMNKLRFHFKSYFPLYDYPQGQVMSAYIDGKLCAYFNYAIDENKKSVIVMAAGTDLQYARYSPGILLMYNFVKTSIEEGNLRLVDFTRGDEQYKFALGGILNNNYNLSFCTNI